MRLVHLVMLPLIGLASLAAVAAGGVLSFLADAFALFRPEPTRFVLDAGTAPRQIDGTAVSAFIDRHEANVSRRGAARNV